MTSSHIASIALYPEDSLFLGFCEHLHYFISRALSLSHISMLVMCYQVFRFHCNTCLLSTNIRGLRLNLDVIVCFPNNVLLFVEYTIRCEFRSYNNIISTGFHSTHFAHRERVCFALPQGNSDIISQIVHSFN